MNTANAVYGMAGSAGLFYLVIGALVFLFVWPPTKVQFLPLQSRAPLLILASEGSTEQYTLLTNRTL
jgi:hypothetical protein